MAIDSQDSRDEDLLALLAESERLQARSVELTRQMVEVSDRAAVVIDMARQLMLKIRRNSQSR